MAYYFRLPAQRELTRDQQLAVEETDSIALSGGPGTGKSVVCLWRHIRNHNLGIADSLLLTYTKTLEHYLSQSAATYDQSAADAVDRTYRWTYSGNKRNFDEIIIDEAQDVGIDRYQIIQQYAEQVSYGADEAQSLYAEKSCSVGQLRGLFGDNEDISLSKNFRNSREILEFTKAVFPNILIPHQTLSNSRVTGVKPFVQKVGWNEDLIFESIVEIVQEYSSDTHNIGILLPGGKQVTKYYDALNNRINCSKYTSEADNFDGIENVHITTFKSAKGMEFDTVIIPNFDSFEWFIANAGTVSDKDYYVALTRTKTNLFLLCKFDFNTQSTNTYQIF